MMKKKEYKSFIIIDIFKINPKKIYKFKKSNILITKDDDKFEKAVLIDYELFYKYFMFEMNLNDKKNFFGYNIIILI